MHPTLAFLSFGFVNLFVSFVLNKNFVEKIDEQQVISQIFMRVFD